MKKYILILLLTSFFVQSQEKAYWGCFNFSVDNNSDAEELVEAMDALFESPAGEMIPYTVFLTQIEFKNSNEDFTHQLCFLGQDASVFKGWGGGPPPTPEGKLLNKIFEQVAEWEGSVLGSPLIFDPSKVGYKYANIWGVDVKDIPKYAELAGGFIAANSNNFDGTIELHEIISGGNDHVTHIMIARSNDLGDWLKGREAVFANPGSEKFLTTANKYSTTIQSFSSTTLRVYNSP